MFVYGFVDARLFIKFSIVFYRFAQKDYAAFTNLRHVFCPMPVGMIE